MLASTKCYQLAVALQAMVLKISYEDVQTATTSIVQCATNVLTVWISYYFMMIDGYPNLGC